MLEAVNLPIILVAALIAVASPGPATLAIAGTSMASGRRSGLALASGISCGSLTWSVAAAAGLSALMLANAWIFEVIRYCGAGYLMWLAVKSARSAMRPGDPPARDIREARLLRVFGRGLALHLTNPKAILFFGALYAIGVPAGTSPAALSFVILAVGLQSALAFHAIALLFSNKATMRGYMRLRRWFEGAFAIAFGAASLKILTARLN
ncbi:LysE family translocator [Breoghania sp. L-A4]|uniref:LysE family translocator n=1 Tax=Breoghania sp. L-A4 TaxID=2304600 RepID=UPI000E35929F|nr:LysE family translocator [Breoghania sp. L-A4]AXS42668.1 LysE family translocator [Breoghania sp. L-A4]